MKTQERIFALDNLWARLQLDQLRYGDKILLAALVGKEVKRLQKLVTLQQESKKRQLQRKLEQGAIRATEA